MTSGRRTVWRDWCLVALLAIGGLIWAVSTDLFWRQDNGVYDDLMARTAPPPSGNIVIVTIDDESMLRLGRFPWPRDTHARMLDILHRAGARAILYDVLFLEPAAGDADLAKAVRLAKPVLPLAMEIPGRNGAAATVKEPLPALRGPGVKIGHTEIVPDRDGVVRSFNPRIGLDGRTWPHVAAITACEVKKAACNEPDGATVMRRSTRDRFPISFTSTRTPFRTVPFSAVLDGGVPDGFFRNQIVLVGATAPGLGDVYATPLSPGSALMPGVNVNANIVQALLDGRTISPAARWLAWLSALVPVMALLATFLLARPLGIFLVALVLVAATGGATLALWHNGIWLSPVAGAIGVGATYTVWAARRLQVAATYMREELEQFRRDEGTQVSERAHIGQFPDLEIDHLHEAIARSRNLQTFMRDTLDGLPDASFVMEPSGTILLQNEAARLLLGDIEGEHFSSILALLPGRHAIPNPVPPTGEADFPAEVTDVDGRIHNVRWSRIHNRDGHVIAWVLRLADVTELRQATRQREEALQLLTHDMRSPQVAILTLLDKADDGAALDKAGDVLARVRHYAQTTLALADGFVQLARAESAPLAMEDVNLPDIVLDAADSLWPQANDKGISISTTGCDQELLVRGDRQLLTRMLINLIDNAIKYSSPDQHVECGVEVKDGAAIVSVCDRGPGIRPGEVDLLFNRFRRASDELTRGAGLGLAFARSVAERHRGTLTYMPRPGGGSCFRLELPLPDDGHAKE